VDIKFAVAAQPALTSIITYGKKLAFSDYNLARVLLADLSKPARGIKKNHVVSPTSRTFYISKLFAG
jgi:hypothetical protein